MNSLQNQEPRFEYLHESDFSQFLLRDRREIAFVLRQLASHRSMITAYHGNADQILMTSIVGLSNDDGHVFLDLGPDEDPVQSALSNQQLLCMTQLEKIKIQFSLRSFERTTYDGFQALRATLPSALLRLQRREYYRLSLNGLEPLYCQVTRDDPVLESIAARVIDISGGGLGLMMPVSQFALQNEMVFKECELSIPDYGKIKVSLRIRSVFRTQPPPGTEYLRIGCQFINLPVSVANVIQRFILNSERDRRAREGG